MLNRVVLMGRLVKDAELKYTQQGTGVLNFRIASDLKMGKENVETLFIDVVVFGKRAEALAEYLKKGQLVAVEGKLRQDNWEDKDGNKRSRVEILMDNLHFVSSPKGNNNGTNTDVPEDIGDDEDIPF